MIAKRYGLGDWTGSILSRLHRDYAARGLQVVGINLYDNDQAIQGCITRNDVQYPVLRGDSASQRN